MPRRTPARKTAAPLHGEVDAILSEVQRYLRRGRGPGGPFGQILSVVMDLLGMGQSPSRGDVERALDVMAESGLPAPSGRRGYSTDPAAWPTGPVAITRSERGRRVAAPRSGVQPVTGRHTPTNRLPPDGGDEWPDEHLIDTRVVSAREEAALSGREPLEWTETPHSSNVYAFAFDPEGVLYVTYKAPSKQTPRPHVTGATYAYGSKARPMPRRVYEAMGRAASKGKFVWDNLRVRGSRWRHQVPYVLAYGGFDAEGGSYIPRKATARGFRVRTVPTVGRGRRRAAGRSNLPEQITPAHGQPLFSR